MKILFQTVGGSDVPLVTAIKKLMPDHVVFICSTGKASSRSMVDGEGKVCGHPPERPNLMKQTELKPEQVSVELVDPDDPYSVYDEMLELLKKHRSKGEELYVDFTGGTKSMSAGLWGASTDIQDCKVYLVKGPRENLEKISGHHSHIEYLNRNYILAKRKLSSIQSLVTERDYGAAHHLMEELDLIEGVSTNDLLSNQVRKYRYLIQAFAEWDNFEYEKALSTLKVHINQFRPSQKSIINYKILAENLVQAKQLFKAAEPKPVKWINGMMLVYDLLRNAERKADKNHFDDAVSRIYRATEMYAQVRLLKYNIHSSNVQIDVLKQLGVSVEQYEEKKKEDKIQISLREDYDLLAQIGDLAGKLWKANENEMINTLKYRNHSLLAHGINPVSEEDFQKFYSVIASFIKKCDENDQNLARKKIGLKYYKDLPKSLG